MNKTKSSLEEKKKKFTMLVLDTNITSNTYQEFKFSIDSAVIDEWWQWIHEQLVKEEVAKAREGHSINCDYCGNRIIRRKSMCVRVKHSFCNHFCYTQYRKKHNYNLSGHSAEGWKNTSN